MNLNYIFSLFILYCKKLLSKEFTKILFCFITTKIILVLIPSNNNKNNTDYKKYRIKKRKELLLTVDNLDSLKSNNYFKDFKVPIKIKTNIKHLMNSTHFKDKNSLIKTHNFDFNKINLEKQLPHNTPILLNDFFIVESFTGNIYFHKSILNVKKVKNTLFLKSSTLILDDNDRSCGVLFLSGYLEIDLTYSTPNNFNLPIISSTSNYVIRVPFNSSLHVKFETPVSGDIFYFNNLNINLKETNYTVDLKLTDECKLDNDISLYSSLKLSIILDYSIELYDFIDYK